MTNNVQTRKNPFRFQGALDAVRDKDVLVKRKNLKEVLFDNVWRPLPRWNIMYGYPEAGKSTLLEGLKQVATDRFVVSISFPHGLEESRDVVSFLYDNPDLRDVLEFKEEFQDLSTFHRKLKEFISKRLKQGDKFFFCIDDLRHIGDDEALVDFLQPFHSLHEELSHHPQKIHFGIIFASRLNLHKILAEKVKVSPLDAVTSEVHLVNFGYSDMKYLIRRGFKTVAMDVPDDIINSIWKKTMGHPALTQRLAHYAFRVFQEGKSTFDSIKNAKDAMKSAVYQIISSDYFSSSYEYVKKDNTAYAILRKIAEGEGLRFTLADNLLFDLELEGIIRDEGGYCRFNNAIFEQFARDYIFDNQSVFAFYKQLEAEVPEPAPPSATTTGVLDRLETLLVGPKLHNFEGFVSAYLADDSGKRLEFTSPGVAFAKIDQLCRLVVAVQSQEPSFGIFEPITIRDGEDVDEVVFEARIDSDSLTAKPRQISLKVCPGQKIPTEGSFVLDKKAGTHKLYVQIFQKTRFIQVVPLEMQFKKR